MLNTMSYICSVNFIESKPILADLNEQESANTCAWEAAKLWLSSSAERIISFLRMPYMRLRIVYKYNIYKTANIIWYGNLLPL